jgi:hypothetical protein
MKKILLSLPAFALAMALAFPVMAYSRGYMPRHSDDDLNVSSNNSANVTNNVDSWSSTGRNSVRGGDDSTILTGIADSFAKSGTEANYNATDISGAGCNCFDDVTVRSSNRATVMNNVNAGSKTGGNVVSGGYSMPNVRSFGHHPSRGGDDSLVDTGDAISTAESWTMVNTNMTKL